MAETGINGQRRIEFQEDKHFVAAFDKSVTVITNYVLTLLLDEAFTQERTRFLERRLGARLKLHELYDVIAVVEAADLTAVGALLASRIHTLNGVVRTVTCLSVGRS